VERTDVLLTVAVMAGAAVITVLVNSMGAFVFGEAPSLREQLVWSVALTAPLVLRRRYPVPVLLVVAAIFIAGQARHVGDNLAPSVVLFLAMYSVGAWGRNRVVARWARIGVIVAMFAYLWRNIALALSGPAPDFEGAAGPLDPVLAAVLHGLGVNVLFFVAAYVFGTQAWESARRQHELVLQGEELRRSHAENARQAVMAERLRIARDLHDVVAHHVSVMGVQAAAARRVLPTDPAVASESLAAVESGARNAVEELRGMLGVLRAELPSGHSGTPGDGAHRAGHQPAPGLQQIGQLVEQTAATGLSVTCTTYGDERPVPDAIALSAYRVVQEALTNTVKHANATGVDVRIRYLDTSLEVEVNDDGRAPVQAAGAGLGLAGMRERVAVHGGQFEAGPRRGGGFQVRARFPLGEAQRALRPVEAVAE
jgi:signal transduction histidine kinase